LGEKRDVGLEGKKKRTAEREKLQGRNEWGPPTRREVLSKRFLKIAWGG